MQWRSNSMIFYAKPLLLRETVFQQNRTTKTPQNRDILTFFCAKLRKTFLNCANFHPPRTPLLQGVVSRIEFNTTNVVLNFCISSHPNLLKYLHLRSTRTPQTGIFFHFSSQSRDKLPFFCANLRQTLETRKEIATADKK